MRTSDDASQFDFIRQARRVIVTHDADFLRYAQEHDTHPGIVYGQMGMRRMGEIIRTLILIYEALSAEEMVGHVEYL